MTQPITAESIQTEMAAQAAELLTIYRAGEVTIAEDAITAARIAAGLSDAPLPSGARETIHTALADAHTQVWRAESERKADEAEAMLIAALTTGIIPALARSRR